VLQATSGPVVHHHGREGGGAGGDEVRPSASTACWAALLTAATLLLLGWFRQVQCGARGTSRLGRPEHVAQPGAIDDPQEIRDVEPVLLTRILPVPA